MNKLTITEEQKTKFKKLKSIHSKMQFWLTEFSIPYYYWYKYTLSDIKDILILCKDEEEREAVNLLTIEEYEKRRKIIANNNLRLFDYESAIEKFKESANEMANLTLFKNQEYKRIDEQKEYFINSNKQPFHDIGAFFQRAYDDCIEKDIAPDYKTNDWELPHLIAMENGFRFAKYYLFVYNFKADSFNAGLDLNDKLFLLSYLGILDNFDKLLNQGLSKNNLAKLLSTLLDENLSNTESGYNKIHIARAHLKKNAIKVALFFDSIKLKELAEDIKKKNNILD